MKNEDESLQNAIYENNKLVNDVENQIKQLDGLRQSIGLNQGASTVFLETIPTSFDKRIEAEKELRELTRDTQTETGSERKKQKKRSKMTRAMRNRLHI